MARSAESVELELPSAGAWREAAAVAIEAWPGADEWSMRLVCTRGPEDGGPPTAYVLGQDLSPSVMRQRLAGVAIVTLAQRDAERPERRGTLAAAGSQDPVVRGQYGGQALG